MRAQGEFALVSEQMQLALQKAGQPVKRGTMAHEHEVYMNLVEAAAQSGDIQGLRRFLPFLESLAEQDDHLLYRAIARRGRGILHLFEGEYALADDCLIQALGMFSELGARWQIGRTLVKLAELALACQDLSGASERFASALVEFEALKAAPDIERVQSALAGLG